MLKKSDYRKTLGKFATGVTIITTRNENEDLGFTANSFTSVSLDPPLVLFCIKNDASFLEGLMASKVFGINVLAEDQENLSNKFANPNLLNCERFDKVPLSYGPLKCPTIIGSMAFLECTVVKINEEGDHNIIIGEVSSFDKYGSKKPLVYYGGGYRTIQE